MYVRRTVLLLYGMGTLSWAQQTATPVDFRESVKAAMSASLESQKKSVQRQSASVVGTVAADASGSGSGFFSVAWPEPPQVTASMQGSVDCEPMPKPELDKLVQEASQKQGLQADLIQAVIGKESAARPCAVSPKGAQGLMQLMPATALELGIADPFDPKENIDGGTKLIKQLLTKYNGDVALALGAYNAGSGRVDREGGIPKIPETMNYVSDILNHFRIH